MLCARRRGWGGGGGGGEGKEFTVGGRVWECVRYGGDNDDEKQ